MKTFYVMWTYIANHSTRPLEIQAESAEKASQQVYDFFSADFKKKGRVFVFDSPPQIFSEEIDRRVSYSIL